VVLGGRPYHRSVPLPPSYADELRAVGLDAGLHRVGVASAEPFASTLADLLERRDRGLHADMQFTYRNPARSTDPGRTLAGVQSLVVGARAYAPPPGAGGAAEAATTGRPLGRVASYVVGDHYGALREGLEAIATRLVGDGHRATVLLDDNALVDRAAAHRAGLGWFGKNANLLLDDVGSWVVIGSVLTDALLPPADGPVPDGCGACTRCLDGCPTGAIVEPGVVDARLCLAWQLQARGDFPAELRIALGDRLYGCDECQEVCPPSRRAARSGAVDPDPPPPSTAAGLDVVRLLGLDDDDLLAEVGRWYIADRDPAVVRRNALLVLANAAAVPPSADVVDILGRYLRHPSSMLRGHAVWAARRLGCEGLLAGLRTDPDPVVRDELARVVEARAGSSRSPAPAGGADPR
jgi:epoxyqueuosine reductase